MSSKLQAEDINPPSFPKGYIWIEIQASRLIENVKLIVFAYRCLWISTFGYGVLIPHHHTLDPWAEHFVTRVVEKKPPCSNDIPTIPPRGTMPSQRALCIDNADKYADVSFHLQRDWVLQHMLMTMWSLTKVHVSHLASRRETTKDHEINRTPNTC